MQLQHATELELYLYAACIRAERELPASNIATAVVKGMSDAANELQRLRSENERLQSESAAFEKLASDYQDVIARLDGEIDRLRESLVAIRDTPNIQGYESMFFDLQRIARQALLPDSNKKGGE